MSGAMRMTGTGPNAAARPERAARPRLLAAIYHNPDYYPPTVNAITQLSAEFRVTLVCRAIERPFRRWPAGVTIERCGASGPDASITIDANSIEANSIDANSIEAKISQGAIAKLAEYRGFRAALKRTVARERPRVIYAWDPHAFAAAIAAGAPRAGIPIVYHLHELPEASRAALVSLQGWINRYALRATRLAATVIFPEKNRAARYLARAGDARAALIVPNCPARDFVPALPPWDDLIARRWRGRELLYMGTLGAANGNLEAVRALGLLDPMIRLTMIGPAGASLGAAIAQLARAVGVAGRVALPGWIPHGELPARAIRAAAGLSLHKAVNRNLEFAASATNKIFEYAACGLPVIVPDRASYRELLEAEGWALFADPDDPAAIARTVDELFADRDRYAARCRAARRSFERRYHYELAFAPALARLRELAARAGRSEQAAVRADA